MFSLLLSIVSDTCALLGQIIVLAPEDQQRALCDHLLYEVRALVRTIHSTGGDMDDGSPH